MKINKNSILNSDARLLSSLVNHDEQLWATFILSCRLRMRMPENAPPEVESKTSGGGREVDIDVRREAKFTSSA